MWLLFLSKFEDLMPESGLLVWIWDFFNRHVVHQSQVLPGLLFLELLDGRLSVVDSQEMNEFAVVLDIFVRHVNLGL